MTLSVIVPTRNRADLWRSGWLLDSLRQQSQVPDELVVALDHTEDDTLAAIRDQVRCTALPFPVRILEVISPRPGRHPASAVPDNCLFATAAGVVIVHLDDDIAIAPEFCRRSLAVLNSGPPAVVWAGLRFVHIDGSPLSDPLPADRRPAMAVKRRWPTAAAGVARLPAHWTVHYGGAWATRRADILELGGHDLTLASFRNADARLGNRMVRAGLESYITFTDDAAAYHLGHTHHSRRQHHDRSRGPTLGQKIANGGRAYWTSEACRQSFRELEPLDSQPRQATM